MKQQEYISAYKVIQKYENEKLPLDIAYGLFKVKKILQDQWDFEVARELEIFDLYNPEASEENTFTFKSVEDQKNFTKDFSELLNMEVDKAFEKVKIDFGTRIEMSVADIEVLSNFIEF